MSRGRVLAIGVMLLVLAGLLAWQHHRQRLITSCQTSGGVWDGRLGLCGPALPSPILKRDLERS